MEPTLQDSRPPVTPSNRITKIVKLIQQHEVTQRHDLPCHYAKQIDQHLEIDMTYILWYQERKFRDVPELSTPKSARTIKTAETVSASTECAIETKSYTMNHQISVRVNCILSLDDMFSIL